jgi:peptidoglycan/xylan/chitin deacetylase (PgdA/CDA1 family)
MPGTNIIVARLQAQIQNGSIILLHDGGGNRWQTVAALPAIIEWCQLHGFRFVTLQQLITDLHT